MRFSSLPFLASLLSLAAADVEFTTPKPGSTLTEGTISVGWQEGSGTTPLAQLTGYTLFLVAGGDTDAETMTIISAGGTHATGGMTASLQIPAAAAGPPGTNAYYLRMISQAAAGGQVINYSQRFTINGMTGKWQTTDQETAYNAAKGSLTSVPATQDQTTSNQNNPQAAGAGGPEYSVSYQFQTTGLTKYAPMQQHPPTSITQQNTAPLFPTSLFVLAATALPTASQVTTMTATITYSYATRVNTATAAPPPNDMQKFLNRWKD